MFDPDMTIVLEMRDTPQCNLMKLKQSWPTDIGVETQVDTNNKFDPEYNCDNNSPITWITNLTTTHQVGWGLGVQ